MYHVPLIALYSAHRWRLDVLTFLIKGFSHLVSKSYTKVSKGQVPWAKNLTWKTHENFYFVFILKKIEMKIFAYIFQVIWTKIWLNIKEHLPGHYQSYISQVLHWDLILCHTQLIVCAVKCVNNGLNHGLFLSLFKHIPCPIHWIVSVLAYLNFIFAF